MTARLLGTLLLACAGAGLGVCGAVRRQAVEKRIRLLSRLWTYLEELLTCRALTACAELRRMADLCCREADRQADRAARAMALWPRLGGCAGLLLAILLW